MVVVVEIEFFKEPTNNEIHLMRLAAQELKKDRFAVEISNSDALPNIAAATFRMKNKAQYKVIDRVALAFRKRIPSYSNMTIWFEQEKAYDLRHRKVEQ